MFGILNIRTLKIVLFFSLFILLHNCYNFPKILLYDDYTTLNRGPLLTDVGALAEYHYLPVLRPKGGWAVSTFRYNLHPSWSVREIDNKRVFFQEASNPDSHWHPIIVAGDKGWQDYRLITSFYPYDIKGRCGIIFRYQNDRQYYFAGIYRRRFVLIKANHGIGLRKPLEKIIDSCTIDKIKKPISVEIIVNKDKLHVSFNNNVKLKGIDNAFSNGKIGFLSDVPAWFGEIKVSTSYFNWLKYKGKGIAEKKKLNELRKNIPNMVLYRKIKTPGFGTGRNLRFGDLNNDGTIEILIGQVVNHGPKDRNSELSCLTAITVDGEILWQKGFPDPWKHILTSDVAFQIYDINNDGKTEVIYCMNGTINITDGNSGMLIRSELTPYVNPAVRGVGGYNRFERILGDCICFCDIEGKGYDSNMILKDRYKSFWVYDSNLNLLWEANCNTGHYPYPEDMDGDGKDEILMGYTLFDDNGKILWNLENSLKDHADGVAIFENNGKWQVICAASDEGMIFMDIVGNMFQHHYIGHVQSPAVLNLRDDLPGLEVVTINYWGNQGIVTYYDSEGRIFHQFEPFNYGALCLPLNWTGISEEFILLNGNVDEGGAWNGYSQKVLLFPDDGHPDMCVAALDIVGDCRDEIVVWDEKRIWIYTQDDNPKSGELYCPKRNPLYNYSNYQAFVSTPF